MYDASPGSKMFSRSMLELLRNATALLTSSLLQIYCVESMDDALYIINSALP